MATKPAIPQSGVELTEHWFTSVFGDRYSAQVISVEQEIVGANIGFVGELIRCTLTWSPAESGPSSLIVKLPAPANRGVGELMQLFEREIIIYRDFGGRLGIPMPTFHHAEFDANPAPWIDRPLVFALNHLPIRVLNWLIPKLVKLSGSNKRRYLLVMEDVADARPPAQVAGGSADDALQALDVLAQFHAHNWMSEVADTSPLFWPLDRAVPIWPAGYLRNRDDFLARFGDSIEPEKIDVLDEIQKRVPSLLARLASPPWTMLHGDYRLDNVLYRSSGDLVVVDYQLVGWGRAGWDVAYFITTALEPDHRQDEQLLLKRYHDALVDAGVSDYPYATLVEDCRATKELLAHRIVASLDTLDTEMSGSAESLAAILVKRVVGWLD